MLFPEPAVDIVGKAIVGRGHHDVWRSRVRGIPEFGGELPVSTHARGDRDAGRGPDPRHAHGRRQPGALDPRRQAARRGARRAWTSWPRSTSTSTRPPGTPTSILPPTTALERDQYDLVFHALAVRNTARFTPAGLREARGRDGTTGRSSARSPCAPPPGWRRRSRLAQGADRAGLGSAVSPTTVVAGAAPHRPSHDDAGTEDAPGGGRPRPAEADHAGPAADQGQAGSTSPPTWSSPTSPGCASRSTSRPGTATRCVLIGRRHQRDNNSWMHNSDAADAGQAAAPAADASRRPRRARPDRRRAGAGRPRGSAR